MAGLGARLASWSAPSLGETLRLIERLKGTGLSNRAIAQRLGVHGNAIRKLAGPSKDEAGEQLECR